MRRVEVRAVRVAGRLDRPSVEKQVHVLVRVDPRYEVPDVRQVERLAAGWRARALRIVVEGYTFNSTSIPICFRSYWITSAC